MGTKPQDVSITIEPEGSKEEEEKELAKAVKLLRRSGMFNVEPVDRYAVGGEFLSGKPISTPLNVPTYGRQPNPSESLNAYGFRDEKTDSPPSRRRTTTFMDAHLFPQPPRLSTFSGNMTKTDVSFEAWLFEVKCLMKDGFYPRDLIAQSVRRSLKGEPGKIIMHLGEDATMEEIVTKLQRVYGVVESGTAILQRFYNSRQEDGEGVAAYGCRLEDIITTAIDRAVVSRQQADEMLRNKFWSGLKDDRIKNVTRHKLECIKDFDSLLAEARAAEQEVRESDKLWGKSARRTQAFHLPLLERIPSNSTSADSTEISSMKSTVENVMKKVNALEAKMSSHPKVDEKLERILARLSELELGERNRDFNGRASDSLNTSRQPSDADSAGASGGHSNSQPLNSRRPARRGRR